VLFTDIVHARRHDGWELADGRSRSGGLKLLFTSGYALETLVARGRIHPDTAILNKPYRRPTGPPAQEVLDSPGRSDGAARRD